MIADFRESFRSARGLWLAIAGAMLLSGSGVGLWLTRSPGDTSVALVNGLSLSVDKFRKTSRNLGFLTKSPSPMITIRYSAGDVLIDDAARSLGMVVGEDLLRKSLIKKWGYFILEDGKFNEENYEGMIIRSSGMKVEDFEQDFATGLISESFKNIVKNTNFTPDMVKKAELQNQNVGKTFAYLRLTPESFRKQIVGEGVSEEEAKALFLNSKEAYMTEADANVSFVEINNDEVADSISVDEDEVKSYYDRHKDGKYYIPAIYSVDYLTFDKGFAESAKEAFGEKSYTNIVDFAAQLKSKKIKSNIDKVENFKLGTGKLPDQLEYALTQGSVDNMVEEVVVDGDLAYVAFIKNKTGSIVKPIEDVSVEIEKIIKEKKIGYEVDRLSMLLQRSVDNANSIDENVLSESLNNTPLEKNSDDIVNFNVSDESSGNTFNKLRNSISKRLSSLTPGQAGRLAIKNGQVVYFINSVEKSKKKKFEDVRKEVEQDLIEQRTREALERAAERAQSELLTSKSDIEALADRFDVKVSKVKASSAEEAKNYLGPNVGDKVFRLKNPKQAIKVKSDEDFLVVRLIELDKKEDLKDEGGQKVEVNNYQGVSDGEYLSSVLDGLVESAKIEILAPL